MLFDPLLIFIWLSGVLAAEIALDIKDLQNFELFKGLVFVGLTSIFIFSLCYIMFKKLALDAEEMLRNQEIILQSEHRSAAGVLASCMAHDANNVLSIISLRTEQLKLMVPDESESS